MRMLIDTNVILDIIFNRKNCNVSTELFRKMGKLGIDACITASSVTDLFYIIRKETHDIGHTYEVMENVFNVVFLFSVTEKEIQNAFFQKWKDFEDCVQYMVAKSNSVDYIITSNQKDYVDSLLPVLTPQECIEIL